MVWRSKRADLRPTIFNRNIQVQKTRIMFKSHIIVILCSYIDSFSIFFYYIIGIIHFLISQLRKLINFNDVLDKKVMVYIF